MSKIGTNTNHPLLYQILIREEVSTFEMLFQTNTNNTSETLNVSLIGIQPDMLVNVKMVSV